MKALLYADVNEEQTSNASSIASTMQQMSVSFGVACAGLARAFFVPRRAHSSPALMIGGINEAFLVLGGFAVVSTIIFHGLRMGDGGKVSQEKVQHGGENESEIAGKILTYN